MGRGGKRGRGGFCGATGAVGGTHAARGVDLVGFRAVAVWWRREGRRGRGGGREGRSGREGGSEKGRRTRKGLFLRARGGKDVAARDPPDEVVECEAHPRWGASPCAVSCCSSTLFYLLFNEVSSVKAAACSEVIVSASCITLVLFPFPFFSMPCAMPCHSFLYLPKVEERRGG